MNVLVLCTGNSARSVILEAILNAESGGRITAYSAGSQPKGEIHPETLALLARKGLSTAGLRSKSWNEFAGPDAPAMDLVITVCGTAAGESCPMWPGAPLRTHWGVEDPAAASDADALAAFEAAFDALHARAARFLDLTLEDLDRATLLREIGAIGADV